MAGKQIAIASERIAEARKLYELTQTPVAAIAGLVGVSRRTLERRMVEWRWVPRRAPRIATDRAFVAAPLAPAGAGMAAVPAHVLGDEAELRRANAAHIQHAVATNLIAIDRILAKAGPDDEAGIERSARTVAAVARALQEMSVMTRIEDETPNDEFDDEDDELPRDIEDIRAELAERLHALIDAATGAEDADPGEWDSDAAAAGR